MRFRYLLLMGLAPLFLGYDCSGGSISLTGGPSPGASWTTGGGSVSVDVNGDPFQMTIKDKSGKTLLESADLPEPADDNDPMRAYAPLAMTHNDDQTIKGVMFGWNYYRGVDGPWKKGAHTTAVESTPDKLTVTVETNDDAHKHVTITITSQGIGAHIVVEPDAGAADDPNVVNRVSLAFKMHDDDHFFGMGERFVRSDHKGQLLYNWVEDGGFGQGENTPPGPANPFPNGEGQTNIPIPWFLSPKGFGLLLTTTFRSVHHLGDETPNAFRLEAWTAKLDLTIFADPDPLRLVEALTEVTGRPPDVADWAFAPRRRANIGTDEMDKLRQAHVPTSVIDTATHYFPNGVGDVLSAPGAMKVVTDDIHKRGFKAIAYFCPFVADSFHPEFDDASAKGYLVKKPDGTPYVVLDPPYSAAMVDFTNPDAVAWYQAHLQRALDDGWDGWMYDFAEYVPQDAVMWNGMTGLEAHNLYPVLYQRAAFDLLEKKKQKDYLIFVRSGYQGTGGAVTMVWAGDQNTDFDAADGLPAALTGALNAGMSGLPLWGSDISGYHFIYNPPPDKELYLRWTEVGAFSADMHDENEGAGNGKASDRWQIWKDAETLDLYKKYAGYKTRMLPYVKVAVRQARARHAGDASPLPRVSERSARLRDHRRVHVRGRSARRAGRRARPGVAEGLPAGSRVLRFLHARADHRGRRRRPGGAARIGAGAREDRRDRPHARVRRGDDRAGAGWVRGLGRRPRGDLRGPGVRGWAEQHHARRRHADIAVRADDRVRPHGAPERSGRDRDGRERRGPHDVRCVRVG